MERTIRFTMLLHLPADHGAAAVRNAITDIITELPGALRRSLTWDQGIELSQHLQLTIDADLPVYFCDPHSPWQRGGRESLKRMNREGLSTDSGRAGGLATTTSDLLDPGPSPQGNWSKYQDLDRNYCRKRRQSPNGDPACHGIYDRGDHEGNQ